MACFIVPLVQAAATSVLRKKGNKSGFVGRNLASLELMLWGGTIMLIVDHIINGELTWAFPFFTALGQEGGGAVMLREMLTVGVPMSLVITAVWVVYALLKERRSRVATI
ncbi:MAG: hypothetical protein J6U34_03300 [Bacteroidales bacterium]|nr:hypothetical protein [Bacteroidales bacterium]